MKNQFAIFLVIQTVLFFGFHSLANEVGPNDITAALATLTFYKDALSKKSIDKMQKFVTTDLTVIEGTHINTSWADYRDNHIGPEMKEWLSFETVETKNVKQFFSPQQIVISEETIYRIKSKKGETRLKALETFILIKQGETWKIALIHFSGKPLK